MLQHSVWANHASLTASLLHRPLSNTNIANKTISLRYTGGKSHLRVGLLRMDTFINCYKLLLLSIFSF